LLQNRILRGELPELRVSPNRTRVFKLTGGRRTTAIECSWNDQTADVRCGRDPEGAPDEFELLLGEEAATDLVLALAAQIANNGTAMSREASMGG
jgi:hypothetical protein